MARRRTAAGISVDAGFFSEHRARLLKALGRDAAILFAPPHRLRNADTEYRYRQSSDVYYLSGWEDPEAVLLLRPGAEKPFVMFVQPKDPEREVWTGVRPGPGGRRRRMGGRRVVPVRRALREAPRAPARLPHDPLQVRRAHGRRRRREPSRSTRRGGWRARRGRTCPTRSSIRARCSTSSAS
jgi:hypothetical protein